MNQEDKIRRQWETLEEIRLFNTIHKPLKKEKPKSEFLKKAQKLDINKRCQQAITDRKITDENYVYLLDKPLKQSPSQIQKAFLIQEAIMLRWAFNKDESLIPSYEKINDLNEFNDDTPDSKSTVVSRDEWRKQCKIPKPINENDEVINPWN